MDVAAVRIGGVAVRPRLGAGAVPDTPAVSIEVVYLHRCKLDGHLYSSVGRAAETALVRRVG